MDHAFWIDRWQKSEIGFHQAAPHDLLERYWPALNVNQGAPVLVPLCGKSLDMVWLAEHGHSVIGTELASAAVEQFFAERSRAPAVVSDGDFSIYRAGPYEVWRGDHFDLPEIATRRIGGVFDRAALVAMPRVLQVDYAKKLAALTPSGIPVLLITLDYDPSEMDGPPFPISPARVDELLVHTFRTTLLEQRDGLSSSQNLKKRGVSRLIESAWKLVRR